MTETSLAIALTPPGRQVKWGWACSSRTWKAKSSTRHRTELGLRTGRIAGRGPNIMRAISTIQTPPR
jgi:hypothetical protein